MPLLRLIDEVTGTAWQVWPAAAAIAPGAVHETGKYLFELLESPDAASADLLIDDLPLEALRSPTPHNARWRWLPGFQAGTVEAELRMPGQHPKRFEVVTDPDLRKLTRTDFDSMLREILEDTFALFSLSSFRKGISRGTGRQAPPIARLEFLRSRVEILESVVAAISRNPRRRLTGEDAILPYQNARRATGHEILRSFRSGRILRERETPSRLPKALRGYLPQHIHVRHRQNSFDVPENRQIAACLRYWAAWLNAASELLEVKSDLQELDDKSRASIWAVRCMKLAQRLSRLSALPVFAEAADAPARLMVSAVFRHEPNYRRFYRLWQDMNLGIAAVFGDFLNLPLARTFELYELWCFLRIIRAAAEEFGAGQLELGDLFATEASGGVTLSAGAAIVPIAAGWKVCFQQQYREFWIEPDGRGSYSRVMVPDVVLVHGPAAAEPVDAMIVLDAKYRIEDGLNDALSSIHTYRDALVQEAGGGNIWGIVTAAYLLAPYIPELATPYRNTSLPGRLFHPEYRSGFHFGAITLTPGMSHAELRSLFTAIIADAQKVA